MNETTNTTPESLDLDLGVENESAGDLLASLTEALKRPVLQTAQPVVTNRDLTFNDGGQSFPAGTKGIVVTPTLMMGVIPAYVVLIGSDLVTVSLDEVDAAGDLPADPRLPMGEAQQATYARLTDLLSNPEALTGPEQVMDALKKYDEERGLPFVFDLLSTIPHGPGTPVVFATDVIVDDGNLYIPAGTPATVVGPMLHEEMMPGYRVICGSRGVEVVANEIKLAA